MFELRWDPRQFQHRRARLLGGHYAAHLRQIHREDIERGQLSGESLRRGDANLRPGVRINRARRFARDHRSHDVADGQRLRSSRLGLALGRDGVSGLARLRNHQRDRVLIDDGIAVAPLAGIVHFHRHARQRLDHELAGLPGMPTGSAGDDVDLCRGAELGLADLHLVEKNVAGLLRDAPQRGVANGARLLVNFLEHEMLEAALLRQDRDPR